MVYLKTETYLSGKPILFGQTASRTPYSVAVKALDVLENSSYKKAIPEGSFVVSVGGNIRFLPRAKVKTAVTTATPSITLLPPCQHFKVGDVLYVNAQVSLVLNGTPIAGDIVNVQINGSIYSVTAAASPTTTTVATQLAALVIPGCTLSSSGNRVTVTADDNYKVAANVIPVNTTSTLSVLTNSTEPGFFSQTILPVGTISSIGTANAAGERTVTLAANSVFAIPAGAAVTVMPEKFLGIYPEPLDLTETPTQHIAPIFHADGVYEKNLPYCDLQIKRILHGLNIEKRFYANS